MCKNELHCDPRHTTLLLLYMYDADVARLACEIEACEWKYFMSANDSECVNEYIQKNVPSTMADLEH